ncbi:MAG TPA: AAA family ATPase [Bacillota bacterium]|nr:AAA family ATPase [Bacillota bacterium]
MTSVWISELKLQGFGLYSEPVAFSFNDGTNIVIGGNETGKSTMAAGICAVLFGLQANIDPTAYGGSRYRNWDKPDPFAGRIVLATDGLSYQIDRDFATHRIRVCEISAGVHREIIRGLHNPRASRPNVSYLTFLRKVTGVETADLFRQIYFVEQPLPNHSSLSRNLQQLLSGGGHYENVRVSLRNKLKDLTRNPERYDAQINPGRKDQRLEARQSELADLTGSIERSRESLDELMSIATELDSLRVALDTSQSRLAVLRSQREALVGLSQLQKRADKATQHRSRLANARQQITELQTLLDSIELQLAPDSDLGSERTRLHTLARALAGKPEAVPGDESVALNIERELVALRSRLEQIKHNEVQSGELRALLEQSLGPVAGQPDHCALLLAELSEARSLAVAQRPDPRPLLTGLALAALLHLLARPYLTGFPYLLPALSALAGAIASMAQFVLRRRQYGTRMRRITDQFQLPVDFKASRLNELAEVARELQRLEAECSVVTSAEISHALQKSEDRLGQWMALSESYRAIREREQRLEGQAAAHRFALTEVARAHGLCDVEELGPKLQLADDDYYYARRAVEEYVRERHELPLGKITESGADLLIAAIDRSERELTPEAAAFDGEIRNLLYRQSRLEGTHPSNIAEAEERQAELANECRSLQLEAQICGLALRELDGAVREFQSEYRQQISGLIEAGYRRMTGKRRAVFFDDEFTLRLSEPDGMEVDPIQLSQGARDQLYIALRLALAEFMSPRSSFPLIFDDPFLTSDHVRLDKIRLALDSAGRQVILLSHNPLFSSWGSSATVLNL